LGVATSCSSAQSKQIGLPTVRKTLPIVAQEGWMDAFSEILSGVKLNGALFFNAYFTAPWGFSAPASKLLTPALAPEAPHLVIYHLVLEGRAVSRLGAEPPIQLEPGDVVVFPHGDPHLITSGTEAAEPQQTSAIIRKVMTRDLSALHAGGGGTATRFVCGFMSCDPQVSRPILDGLPRMFKVNVRTDRSGQWLESTIMHLVEEAATGAVGSEAMLAKLSEALFVDTLRRYVKSLPEREIGWLAGTRDSLVGKCLGLMHSRVDHPWTIAKLADEVGASRSALSERFTSYLAEPPMTYLTRWRLQLASRNLTSTPKGVAEIASSVGYESEAAFNRAFKRHFGVPPARYRREQRASLNQPAETPVPAT
jgi:AraC-like DNA-binding protein